MEPTLDEIQKLLLLVQYLGMQGLSLAVGPLVGGAGDAAKAAQKQSQVERLRKELDAQVSTHLSTQLPAEREVKALMLISHLARGIDALCRDGVRIGASSPAPPLGKEARELFEAGCDALVQAIAAFTQRGTSAAAPALRQALAKQERLEHLLEKGSDEPIRRLAIQARDMAVEIGLFLSALPPAQPAAASDRARIGKS